MSWMIRKSLTFSNTVRYLFSLSRRASSPCFRFGDITGHPLDRIGLVVTKNEGRV